MKRLLTAVAALLSVSAYSQNMTLTPANDSIPSIIEQLLEHRDSTDALKKRLRHIRSHINLEFASSANAYFIGGRFDEFSFQINRVRLEIYGRLNRNLSYHFRQSFNRYSNPNAVDNLSSSIEYANITWHQSDRFELVAGKQFLALAGYEGYVNALRVREFCDFNNNVEVYQTGVMGLVRITPVQHLMIQIANNRSSGDAELYRYGLPEGVQPSRFPVLATLNWNGWFADKSVHLMYSASVGELAKGKNVWYFMCGNIYDRKPILAYLDVLYSRQGIDSQQRITLLQNGNALFPRQTAQNVDYLTFIGNVDYQFHPKWNAYVKGVYETASVYKANGVFEKGRYLTSWNAQACIEWFPFTEDKGLKVFAHYLYKGYHLAENAKALRAVLPHTQRISVGLVYIIPVL